MYDIDHIRKQSESKLIEMGLSGYDAEIVVDTMISSDMCGVGTHGIRMLPAYIKKLSAHEFSTDEIEILRQTPAFTRVNAHNSVGAVSACKCMKIAIAEAKKYGVHAVFSNNCNTYGAAFYYAEMAADQGLVGFTCCNSPAAMPAYNGAEPMLGTNPMAFVCPSKSEGNIIFDMATSIVAKSRLGTALTNGEALPEGWALDKNGIPTTDPEEAIKGLILPMAGFKGYGLAMIIDIVAGFLSGAGYLNRVNKFYSSNGKGMNVGHLFIAVDPAQVYEGDFLGDMDEYIRLVRSSKKVGTFPIVVPGDNKNRNYMNAEKNGIALADDTVEKLKSAFGTDLQEK